MHVYRLPRISEFEVSRIYTACVLQSGVSRIYKACKSLEFRVSLRFQFLGFRLHGVQGVQECGAFLRFENYLGPLWLQGLGLAKVESFWLSMMDKV